MCSGLNLLTTGDTAETRRNNNVIIMSKRRRDVVLTFQWRYYYVMCPLGMGMVTAVAHFTNMVQL